MKKYENGEYIELSQEELAEVEKTRNEYIEEAAYVEAEKNPEDVIKETATGRAMILTDISNNTENLLIKVKGDATGAGRVVYVMGQNIWDEKCEYDSSSLYLYSKNYIHVIPGTKYYLYCNSPASDWEEYIGLFTEITYYNIAFQEISRESNVKRNSIITTPLNCYYMKFKIYEMYGDEYKNDICINLYDKRINGTYDSFKKEYAYDSNINGDIAIPKPEYSVITLFTEDDDVFLECEYSKNMSKVLAEKQDKMSWELIAQGELTEEVSQVVFDGFSCSDILLSLAVASSQNNSTESYLQVRTNKNANAGGGTDSTSLSRIFRTTGSATKAYIQLEMKNKWITGQLFSSAGAKANYMNNSAEYDSITGVYLQPVTSGIVFGVGTTYELWGVRK